MGCQLLTIHAADFFLLNFTASVDFVATQNKKTNGQNLVYLINGDYLLLEQSAFENGAL